MQKIKRLARERYKIEVENSKSKNKRGYIQASATGSFCTQIQRVTTIVTVNLEKL
nr:hypothetical protein [Bacillus cereus]